MIDLHTHSTCSDGTLTPLELAGAAVRAGLSAVALTDHDTTDGLEAFLAAAAGQLRAVPGVELSAEYGPGTMHIVGLFVAPGGALEKALRLIRDARAERNRAILDRLAAAGVPLSEEEVRARAGSDVIARPHFARALVARGHAPDLNAAFDRWLGKGRPAYVARRKLPPAECIRVIHAAGGVAVLAHPASLGLLGRGLSACVRGLVAEGLDGIEVYGATHTPAQIRRYRTLARECGLAESGGSDFHGAIRPMIRLGRGFGTLQVPEACLDALDEKRRALNVDFRGGGPAGAGH
jgi:3',5'-nucleoside bisphosphate phosphatase